ncbi:hypothetical protein HT031_000891 [Scenedesmus sp. PABB004]|nr:hypothetical protein HT031_000891 [Scenedesmus sp. PABB004]
MRVVTLDGVEAALRAPTPRGGEAAPAPRGAPLARLESSFAASLSHVHPAPQRRRARSAALAAPPRPPDHGGGAAAGSAGPAARPGGGAPLPGLAGAEQLPPEAARELRAVMDLWHLHSSSAQRSASGGARGSSPRALLAPAPRLLTAEEEAALGSIVQQHRRLAQVYAEHPGVAAELERELPLRQQLAAQQHARAGAGAPSGDDDDGGADGGRRRGARVRWPPPLSAGEVAAVRAMPRAWRAMLPELAAKAHELLVAFNISLVFHMLQFATRRSASVPTEDRTVAGLAGLQQAAARFDPARGARFGTVAAVWILQHMQRAADAQGGALRTPGRHAAMARRVLDTHGTAALFGIADRPDVLAQVAAAFNTKPATVLRAVRAFTASQYAASLDDVAAGPGGSRMEPSAAPWSAMLTASDLEDEGEQVGPGAPASEMAGHGSVLAAAGQLPDWLDLQAPAGGGREGGGAGGGAAAATAALAGHLAALAPRERAVITALYGDGLGLAGGGDGAAAPAAGRRRATALRAEGAAPGAAPAAPGERAPRAIQGGVTLGEVAAQLGCTVECVRQLRVRAFRKLRAAVGVDAPRSRASAGGAGGAGAGASADAPPGSEEALTAAVAACGPTARPLMLALAEHVRVAGLPTRGAEVVDGRCVGVYLWKLVRLHAKGQLRPVLAAALDAAAPGWRGLDAAGGPPPVWLRRVHAAARAGRLQEELAAHAAAEEAAAAAAAAAAEAVAGAEAVAAAEAAGVEAAPARAAARGSDRLAAARASRAGGAVEAAIRACKRADTQRALRALADHVAAVGAMPGSAAVERRGVRVGRYAEVQASKARAGTLPPDIRAAFEAIAPGWLARAARGRGR